MDLSYNKKEMENEISELKAKYEKYEETIADLDSCIQIVSQNWVEHDIEAQKVLSELTNEHKNFKNKLEEMHSLMEEFTTNMGIQINDFHSAENKIMSQF